MLFKWKDSFSVGIPTIDNQHQRLFELGSQLFAVLTQRDGLDNYDRIMALLTELKDYSLYHFETEEKLMGQHGYAAFETHKKEHDAFVDKISAWFYDDIDGNQQKVTMEMVEFIANWIEKHILKTDMQYKGFFIARGVV